MGTKTFGKASVQNIYDLEDGSALKLTTAYYYTKSDRQIDGRGILPNRTVELYPEMEGLELEGEKDKLRDPQVAVAVDLLKAQLLCRESGLTE